MFSYSYKQFNFCLLFKAFRHPLSGISGRRKPVETILANNSLFYGTKVQSFCEISLHGNFLGTFQLVALLCRGRHQDFCFGKMHFCFGQWSSLTKGKK
jgi:hypothetical protein